MDAEGVLVSVPTVNMHSMLNPLIQPFRSLDRERGAALAEWGLLVVLIAIVALIALSVTGEEVSGQYSSIASAVTQ